MKEWRNQLWAEVTSHQARREVRKEAVMLVNG